MAHKKASGSTAQGGNRHGKHRGVKRYAGEVVKEGTILIRQLGTVVRPGNNTGMGRDYTIFAKTSGVVKYKTLSGNKKQISVVPSS